MTVSAICNHNVATTTADTGAGEGAELMRTGHVGDLMSRQLLTVREDNGVELALREMRRIGVRRAPVVGAQGELVGVLSIDDVVAHLAAQLGHIADIIRLEQQIEAGTRP